MLALMVKKLSGELCCGTGLILVYPFLFKEAQPCAHFTTRTGLLSCSRWKINNRLFLLLDLKKHNPHFSGGLVLGCLGADSWIQAISAEI
jgi:hypothetical protein